MAITNTTIHGLQKHAKGDFDWDVAVNATFDTIDDALECHWSYFTANAIINQYSLMSPDMTDSLEVNHAEIDVADRRPAVGIAEDGQIAAATAARFAGAGRVVTNGGWSWTVGKPVYLSTTTGAMKQYPEFDAVTGEHQLVGMAIATTKVLFYFDYLRVPASMMSARGVQGTNSGISWGSVLWDATDSWCYRQTTVTVEGDYVDMVYQFVIPNDKLAIPNGATYPAFEVRYKVDADSELRIMSIEDTSGNSITSGMPAVGTSTTIATLSINGSAFDDQDAKAAGGNPFVASGICHVICRAQGGTPGLGNVWIEDVAELHYARKQTADW